ncbi:hypothetical protein MM236_19440 [Belliella sp. DSM 107340]|uniref:SprT-like domain-containing protein n=1 Tax=Belliella calami TaxID=2923436 RepID=A0ABS9UU92_9BACT|nr:hypothetical protein [Belliella calami]MCH7400176.1 hypothetical protein [Belliella calami]
MRLRFTPPPSPLTNFGEVKRLFGTVCLAVVMMILSSSCRDDLDDFVITELSETEDFEVVKVKRWFEKNQSNLSKANTIVKSTKEVSFTRFEKRPDWQSGNPYKFNDGRDVVEVFLKNTDFVYPSHLKDEFSGANLEKAVVSNLMFVERPGSEDYSVFVVRYYPKNRKSARLSQGLSYHKLPAYWEGEIGLFTPDEVHVHSFVIDNGYITQSRKYLSEDHVHKNHIQASTCSIGSYQICQNYVENDVVVVNCRTVYYNSCYNPAPPLYLGGPEGSGGGGSGPSPGPGDQYVCDSMDPNCIPHPGVGGGELPDSEPEEEDQVDMDGLTNCHKNIIQDLIGSTQQEFKRIFEKFNGNQPVPANYNVKFQYGTCPTGATACTTKNLDNGWATITISQSVNQNATDLSFARTVLHETLHSYLFFEQNYPSNCDLNCLLIRYIAEHGPGPNDVHHNLYVETKFLNDIATELRNYATDVGYNVNALGDQYFKDMAWGGLHETNLFKAKPMSEQNRINARVKAELTGGSQTYGSSSASPMGITACD